MGIDAQGYFDIQGVNVSPQYVADLNEKFVSAGFFTLPERTWFLHREGFVEINFDLERYWGPGYERGPFLSQLQVLGWLLRNLPEGGRVFYDGDCVSLDESEPWTFERVKKYLDHFLTYGYATPYNRR
jgi:hypothetical protein